MTRLELLAIPQRSPVGQARQLLWSILVQSQRLPMAKPEGGDPRQILNPGKELMGSPPAELFDVTPVIASVNAASDCLGS